MDPQAGHLRHEDLLASAVEHRRARACRRPRPPPALRLDTRLWWAGRRPRVETWPRALLDI